MSTSSKGPNGMERSGLTYCREHFGVVEADSDGPCDFAKDEFFNDEGTPCDLTDLWYYEKGDE